MLEQVRVFARAVRVEPYLSETTAEKVNPREETRMAAGISGAAADSVSFPGLCIRRFSGHRPWRGLEPASLPGRSRQSESMGHGPGGWLSHHRPTRSRQRTSRLRLCLLAVPGMAGGPLAHRPANGVRYAERPILR